MRRLTDEFTAATSPLPDEIRERTQQNLLPLRLAPLVRELAPARTPAGRPAAGAEEPELDRIKDVTATARWLSKASEARMVRALQHEHRFGKGDAGGRLDMLGLVADVVGLRSWSRPGEAAHQLAPPGFA